jgi:hypothetical protein
MNSAEQPRLFEYNDLDKGERLASRLAAAQRLVEMEGRQAQHEQERREAERRTHLASSSGAIVLTPTLFASPEFSPEA